MLLLLVYGAFLMLVGVTASALVAVTSMHLSTSTLTAVISRDRSLVELFVNGNLRLSDLEPNGLTASRAADVEEKLAALTVRDEILRIEVRDTEGEVLLSSADGVRGERPPLSEGLIAALGGEPVATIVDGDLLTDPAGPPLTADSAVQEYLPIQATDGTTLAVVAMWRDAAPLLAGMDAARRDIVLVTLAAAVLVGSLLYFVFRAAQARITRQQAQLLDAERRDPLTGLLNHGAVVASLSDLIERGRASEARIGIALLDIDNFRLFNDAHGHDAGDEVLMRVADQVAPEAGEDGIVARYGPDEFLVVRPGATVAQMEDAIERVRTGLAELSVQFGESERLPVSVSAGICAHPDHADSVTDLLSAAVVAVAEARASGGDAVRVARIGPEESVHSGSFDVLQGLVIAVDTKDRYTKRHSEDVARYAVFLARQLGLDDDVQDTLRVTGMLHDVGKIGIPDVLLRKPGRLSAEEFEIFKQHVALGDAIVRDVPNVQLVRSGILHHHERWDGHGYLAGLEGAAIPLLGRILAVADAFSAMTTTRPYRKALPLTEALKRLGDAAGSQLQEELVEAFITGIETAADAPLPGDPATRIWSPVERVA